MPLRGTLVRILDSQFVETRDIVVKCEVQRKERNGNE